MLDGQWHSFARDLAIHAPSLSPDALCRHAFTLLTDNPHWPGLAVVDEAEAIVGLLSRRACLSILAKPLMLDLYAKRPVARIMAAQPLTIEEGASLDEIGERIARQRPDALVDGFIITRGSRYAGVASPLDLLAKTTEQARRRAEAIQHAGEAAEAANAAKSTFLANLSHEIRTPLNGVLANLELLAHTRIDAEQATLVTAASVAAQALFEIIGDVLDLSKIEAGKLAVESIPLEPVAVVRDIAVLMGSQARQQGLALGCHVEPSAALAVRGDPTRLRQVVMNIAGNAMKFTKTGGIFLHVFRADDGSDAATAELVFEICDTGIGFAPDKAASLFDAFTQEDASTTRRFGGTGLGLAICKALVELMGGTIGCEGQMGGGATFWCRIPFPLAENPALPPANADASGLRVLVVGGETPWRARLKGMLEAAGVDGTDCPTAAAALRVLNRAATAGTPFDAVLVPVDGADADALALPGRCRHLPTRPIMLSERNDLAGRRAGYFAGYRHLLAMPARPADLVWGLAVACERVPRWKAPCRPATTSPPWPPNCAPARAPASWWWTTIP
ncbi:MAG: ATP-binding protein [Magnetospirillum sp.]|nr:ATP-binding protein [Magnetospirillum sp.]